MKNARHAILLLFFVLLITFSYGQRVVPIGSGVIGSNVFDMIEYDGKMVIGGFFQSFNGHARNNIQGWDGTQHFDMAGAFEGQFEKVRALEVFQGDLIAAGGINSDGMVYRWNGTQWSEMGTVLDQSVNAIAIHNGELYVGGGDKIWRWTGSSWQQFGSAFNADVYALASYQGVLYAGGAFTALSNGGASVNGAARWNGNDWEQLGSGLNGPVLSFLSAPEGLYISGGFSGTMDGTAITPGYTLYDGVAFSEEQPLPHSNGVIGVYSSPSAGLFICGNSDAVLVKNGIRDPINLGNIRVALEYNGHTYVAGQCFKDETYATISRIAEVINGVDRAQLDVNDIKASFDPTPVQFNTWDSDGPGFEVPNGGGVHSITEVAFWLTGKNDTTFYSSTPWRRISSTLGTVGWAGPTATIMDDAFYRKYHQVWKLDRSQLVHHALHYQDADYVTPYVIATWPGNGDVTNGEPAIIAPFEDINENGIYEPESGELPQILGDQAVYTILHTMVDVDSLNPAIKADMHVMNYCFSDSMDPDSYNTVFTNMKLVHRDDLTFTNVRFGIYADMEIGCWMDDFAGCDSTKSLFFTYNRDEFDEDCQTTMGYHDQPPAQGAQFLNEPMTSFSYFNRPGGTPLPVEDIIHGTSNGEPFMYLGYPTHFLYTGEPFLDSIVSPAMPDRLCVGAIGPYTLGPGDELCMDMAFPFARATSGGALASVAELKTRAAAIQTFYDAQQQTCGTYPSMVGLTEQHTSSNITLYPNPAHDQVTIQSDEPLGTVQILDAQGRVVKSTYTKANTVVLSMNDIGSGLYLVRTTDGGSRSQRLVVQ